MQHMVSGITYLIKEGNIKPGTLRNGRYIHPFIYEKKKRDSSGGRKSIDTLDYCFVAYVGGRRGL